MKLRRGLCLLRHAISCTGMTCYDSMDLWSLINKPSDDPDVGELHKKLGLEDLATLIRRHRLRWFGHVERSSDEQ